MKPRLQKVTDQNREAVLAANEGLARRRALLLLYGRYVCFRVFLDCAAEMTGGITENCKLRWLLIQVAPVTLLNVSDIFSAFTRDAGGASTDFLNIAIAAESRLIEGHLPQCPPLFCVLDEAQVLTDNLDHFRSEMDHETRRPILREFLHSWGLILPNLIVSGTGISMRDVETVFDSMVAKYPEIESQTVTEIGAFDNENDQQAYLAQYLPPGFLDTSQGKEVASRVGYWLRGRFVFNSAV
jgi:hypothetical protein